MQYYYFSIKVDAEIALEAEYITTKLQSTSSNKF